MRKSPDIFQQTSLLLSVLIFAGLQLVHADLFVARNNPSQLLRLNNQTHALLGTSVAELPVEEFTGLAIGPDGNAYVLDNTLGDGTVFRFDGKTGAYLGVFISSRASGELKSPRAMVFG